MDEWEFTNSLPRLVEITVYLDPLEEFGDPVELKRVVEIPLGSHEDMGGDASATESGAGKETAESSAPSGEASQVESEVKTLENP